MLEDDWVVELETDGLDMHCTGMHCMVVAGEVFILKKISYRFIHQNHFHLVLTVGSEKTKFLDLHVINIFLLNLSKTLCWGLLPGWKLCDLKQWMKKAKGSMICVTCSRLSLTRLCSS